MSDGTVLIVDDEPAIRKLLTRVAASCGYESLTASNGHEAIVMSRDSKINLILLDIMMNGNDEGFEVIRRLRASGNEIPIIVLSGRTEDFDTLYGLDIGADDYITKPFNPVEVLARVKSQLRRYTNLGSWSRKTGVFTAGGLQLDDESKTVTVDGEPVTLTPIEYSILRLLIRSPGKVYSSGEIYRRIWNEIPLGSEGAVAVHVRHIREKIEINPSEPRYLQVVWGQGYKIAKQGDR